jgi:hypothetical protein
MRALELAGSVADRRFLEGKLFSLGLGESAGGAPADPQRFS